jgi:hypothetical protein
MAHPELDELERREKLRLWRTWCFMLGLVTCATAGTTLGMSVGNPKAWSSAYDALSSAGALTWLMFPLLAIGGILLLAALALTAIISRP